MAGTAFRVAIALPPGWQAATEEERRAYRERWRELVKDAKDRELSRGLDRFGAALAPLAASTRKHRRSAMGQADPTAPPLTPARGASRTRSLFMARIVGDAIECYWSSYQGQHWGRVLRYHAQGAGRLPMRDVIGLSPESVREVSRTALAAWRPRNSGPAIRNRKPSPTKTTFTVYRTRGQ